jgi:hypothetical protein
MGMGITRQNYEVIFMDYLDGKLGDEEIRALMTFLDQHPDLKQELDEFKQIELVPDVVQFLGKDLLKKDLAEKGHIKAENFPEFCIAYYEGSLNERLRNELQEFVFMHPEWEKDFILFSRVYVSPDMKIKYPWKNKLKKGRVLFLTPGLRQAVALAASLALLAGIYFLFPGRVFSPADQAGISRREVPLPYDLTGKDKTDNDSGNNSIALPGHPEQPVFSARDKHISVSDNNNSNGKYSADLRMDPVTPLQAESLVAGKNLPDIKIYQEATSLVVRNTNYPAPVLSLPEYAKKEFREKVLDDALQLKDQKVSAWDVAGFGIKAFNKITGSEVQFKKEYSQEGELIAVVIDSKNFGISKTLKNN